MRVKADSPDAVAHPRGDQFLPERMIRHVQMLVLAVVVLAVAGRSLFPEPWEPGLLPIVLAAMAVQVVFALLSFTGYSRASLWAWLCCLPVLTGVPSGISAKPDVLLLASMFLLLGQFVSIMFLPPKGRWILFPAYAMTPIAVTFLGNQENSTGFLSALVVGSSGILLGVLGRTAASLARARIEQVLEARRAEQTAHRGAVRLDEIFLSIPAPLLLCAPDGRPLRANFAAQALLGENLGAFPSGLHSALEPTVQASGGSEGIFVHPMDGRIMEIPDALGEKRRYEVLVAPLSPSCDGAGWVLLLHPAEHTDDAGSGRDLFEILARVAGRVAHDLNNSLAGILAAAEVLTLGTSPEHVRQRKLLSVIMQATQKATAQSRQLLAVGRRGETRREIVRLDQLVLEVEPLLRAVLGETCPLEITAPPASGSVVQGDGLLLQNVLLQLVHNASEAMPSGGIARISFAEVDDGSRVWHRMTVRDEGVGVAADVLPHVFEPFFTGWAGSNSSGLGLTMVRAVVEDHGGTIEIRSTPGVGSEVEICLPRPGSSLHEGSETTVGILPVREDRGLVLVVDDEGMFRNLLRHWLEHQGWTVIEASDGESALKRLDEMHRSPDVLLLDLVMPRLGGREILRRLEEEGQSLSVVVMTGFDPDADIDVSLESLGVKAVLRKPFQLSLLRKTLESFRPPRGGLQSAL